MKLRWGNKKKSDASAQSFASVRSYEPRRVRDEPTRSASSGQFTRSRTISSYTPVVNPDLSRLSAHELVAHRRRLVRILVGCIAAVLVLAFLVTQLTASIGTISYAPATMSEPDSTAIKKAVDDYYSSRPLERLRFLLNRTTLSEYLANKVPEIASVQSVSGEGIGVSRLAFNMRTPVASWTIGSQTVYVDSNGVSFTQNYYAAPTVIVDDQSGAATSTGTSAIASSSMIRYIGQLIALLQSNGTGTVQRVVLPAGMIRELDIYLQGRAYRVKVQLDRDVASQAADVKSAVQYLDAHGGATQYVDVRVPGKAYYQ